MKKIAITLAVMFTCTSAVSAQDPVRVGMRVGDPPASAEIDVIGYDSGGRRDPFMSLVVPRRPTPARVAEGGPRPTGLAALSINDTQIRGIVRHGDEMLAIAEGPDNQSFVLHVRDRLFDAEVKAIDGQGVLFVERLDGESGREPRQIRKPLRPAAEGGNR